MLLGADSFAAMTAATMALADDIAGGRVVLMHEGGYSDVHAPFCAHAAISTLAGVPPLEDPLGATIAQRQPDPATTAFQLSQIDAMATALAG